MTTTTQTSNRLLAIETRHRRNRISDALFAACIALTAAVSLISVSTASHTANNATAAITAPTSQVLAR